MALTQVRVKLGDTWTVLTYNASTGRYEGDLTAPGTSIDQPGGYYSLEADAALSSGASTSLSGAQYKGLRLVVRETDAPALTLVSPPAGYLTIASPAFVLRAEDEAGGSGIDTTSAQAAIDGVSAACTVTSEAGGYRISFAGSGLSEGPHTVTAAISDRDGNQTTISAAYIVDTVPPVLYLTSPGLHRAVDVDRAAVAGQAFDLTTPDITVTVGGQTVSVDEDGKFAVELPLAIGENSITVTARDGAGLETSETVCLIRLITDRTEADVEQLLALLKAIQEHGTENMTDGERALWAGVLKGGYDWRDFNRVGAAVQYLTQAFQGLGYAVSTATKTDWTRADAQTRSQMDTYLSNVAQIRDVQGLGYLTELPLPEAIPKLTLAGANQIEAALVAADEVIPRYRAWSSGEITCGGV